ncbi:hypothetical protein Taro_032816 [Colocasia esculenta]|uniref:Uncharacterized protein n=1 Tax=Colocasia esculenta TaxID=4460 RepID=A0A843VM94_COLES|nr:hypothetical protein [Colocasia esculenta]
MSSHELKPNLPSHHSSRGIYILYEDVKSCQYDDVHVLWSILLESHPPSALLPPLKLWQKASSSVPPPAKIMKG